MITDEETKKAELKARLHDHVADMDTEELKDFAFTKFDELEAELMSTGTDSENVSAYLLRVRVLTEVVLERADDEASEARSDAGWAAENARWEHERNRYNSWESMGS